MKIKWTLILKILFTLINVVTSILTNYDRDSHITENPIFGCYWYGGGLGATLICTCRPEAQEFYIQENSIPGFNLHTIRIDGCEHVKFGSNAIQNMRNIRLIELANIKNLDFEERSLYWDGYVTSSDLNTPTIKISITNSRIHQISSYTFKGKINEIKFENTVIENIAPFAFSSLTQTQNIEFFNSEMKNVQSQAFKKFSCEYLTITSSKLELLPSRSFSELTVTESFVIQNSTINTIKPSAFWIYNPRRFEVVNTDINVLEGEGFKVVTRSDVLFKNNYFDTVHDRGFFGISVNFKEVPVRKIMTFENLVFNTAWSNSLEINKDSFETKFKNILIREPCDCDRLERDFRDVQQDINCMASKNEQMSYEDFKNKQCSIPKSYATIIIIVCVCLILVIIIVSALVFYFKKVYKSGSYGNEKNGKLKMIVPDGRTYRETELHVIVERADLLTTDL